MSGFELSYPAYTISGSMLSRILTGEGVSAGEIADMWGTSAVFTEGSVTGAMYVVPSSGLCGGGCCRCCGCSSCIPFNFPNFLDFRAVEMNSTRAKSVQKAGVTLAYRKCKQQDHLKVSTEMGAGPQEVPPCLQHVTLKKGPKDPCKLIFIALLDVSVSDKISISVFIQIYIEQPSHRGQNHFSPASVNSYSPLHVVIKRNLPGNA